MNKAHSLTHWENYPSINTPLNEANLNKLDNAVNEIDNRVVEMDTTKATKVEVSELISDLTYNEATGEFTIRRKNGSQIVIDTKLEKLAVNFSYDKNKQQLIIILDDGTRQYVDLSALITQYEFLESDTIHIEINADGKVAASVKNGSIGEEKLEPNYLAKIKVEVAKAQSSVDEVAALKAETEQSATEAAASVAEASKYAGNAAKSEEMASFNASVAKTSATKALASEQASKDSETVCSKAVKTVEDNAAQVDKLKKNVGEKAEETLQAAKSAAASQAMALENQLKAENAAEISKNYAVGETESAKYYAEQAKSVSESLKGSLKPMGTIAFTALPSLENVNDGDMYNISTAFTTTSRFKEGAGKEIPEGANIYKTADGYWDVLAGTPVTGVKGNEESTYRRGNVNLTAEDIGAVAKTGEASDTTVTFTQASARVKPSTGEKLSAIIGKIVKWLTDLKTVAFSGSYKDLSDTPSSLPADGGNASTVNGHTVNSNVPANAKFTDTNTWRPLGTTADTACAGNDSRLSNARPASDVYSWAKAASKPSYSWSEIGSKPSTFTPSAHNHTKSQISDFPSSLPANGGTATYANHLNIVAGNEIRLGGKPSNVINLFIGWAWADGTKAALINDYHFLNGNGQNYADVRAKRLIGDLSAAYFSSPLVHSRQCSWINIRDYSAIKSPAASGGSFLPVMSVGANSGVWTIGNLSGEKTLTFVFTLDSDYNSGNNKIATRVTLPPTASGDFITSSGGTMTGPLYMNGKILYLYSTTCRIEANAQDVNIISAGSGTNASGYINLRPNAAVQVRDTSNSSWKPISALAFNTQSSRRYKKNIVDMSEEEAKRVLRYRVVKYDCINENDGTGCEGLIAEEVVEVDEYPVYRTPDGTIEGLDYSKFVPQLIKMVQLQQKEIDELRKELGR